MSELNDMINKIPCAEVKKQSRTWGIIIREMHKSVLSQLSAGDGKYGEQESRPCNNESVSLSFFRFFQVLAEKKRCCELLVVALGGEWSGVGSGCRVWR